MHDKVMRGLILSVLALTAVLFSACGKKPSTTMASYLTEDEDIREVCETLQDAGLQNTDTFEAWVKDFAETSASPAGMTAGWVEPDTLSQNRLDCADHWQATHDYSDADCRMTAMLLMGVLIQSDTVEEPYDGTYLMFDTDAIENVDRYEILRQREALFTTLFGEMDAQDGIEGSLPNNWKEHGIRLNSDKVTLISVVLPDVMLKEAFVGHAGLLIDTGDGLLFVEKIAFEQPYQATKLKTTDDLIALLSSRPDYLTGEGEETAVIFQNDKMIGRIKKQDIKGSTMKEIYLAGGCFWGTQKFFDQFEGVVETEVGYANGKFLNPTYEQVCREGTGHAETVRIKYDENVIPLKDILEKYFLTIDPLSVNRQGGDVGEQYRTGIYYEDEGLLPAIEAAVKAEEEKVGQKLAVEVKPLENFSAAEEYHQKYLDKNPFGYCHIPRELMGMG